MSTTTTNYGLIKPDTTDPILIGQLNDNADAIDAALKENADAIENKPDAADIPTPSTAAPAMDGTAAAGTSTDYARADHIHPSDTSKQDALTTPQLAAVNSGIDSTKVEQIETNKNNILSKAITGNCNTAAATAAKEVSIDGFVLVKGAIIGVKFGNTNSAANVTLNVNSTGAKSIYHNNAVYTGVSYQICGKKDTYTYYMYDGTYWCWLAIGENTAPAHLITTNTSTSITITGLDSIYNTNCILLCTDRRTSNAVDSVYFVSRYNTVVRIAVLSGNTSPTATISGDVITISNLRTYQTITVLAAETVGIAVS